MRERIFKDLTVGPDEFERRCAPCCRTTVKMARIVDYGELVRHPLTVNSFATGLHVGVDILLPQGCAFRLVRYREPDRQKEDCPWC